MLHIGPLIYSHNRLFIVQTCNADFFCMSLESHFIRRYGFPRSLTVSQCRCVGRCISVHYLGQHGAYQAKTCSLSAPLPFVLVSFPPSITPQYVVIRLVCSASTQCIPSHCTTFPPISFNRVCARLGARARVICHLN